MSRDEDGEEDREQPKGERVEQVPLGIRKPKSPKFDSAQFAKDQRRQDEEAAQEMERKVAEGDLDAPDLHQDYEILNGDEYDRHLEGIASVNAIKELIARAKQEVEDELETPVKAFSVDRMDELMVFTREAITGHGEEAGYEQLRRRVRQLVEEDQRLAEREMDRRKEAYLRSAGK